MNGVPDEFRRKLTSFGRRKGKTLRTHHRGLMDNELPAFRDHAGSRSRKRSHANLDRLSRALAGSRIWRREHLAADAERHGGVAFIGCEPFQNGVAKLLALIEERGLEMCGSIPATPARS